MSIENESPLRSETAPLRHPDDAPMTEHKRGASPSLKRRASSPLSDYENGSSAAKRTKVENDDPRHREDGEVSSPVQGRTKGQRSPSPRQQRPSASGPDRRKDFSQEERKRGQRLFGGLLATIGQKPRANAQQQKRSEIEKRQQERAAKQKIEDEKRRAERVAKLNGVRRVQQVKFEEQAMKTRHESLLARAQSLKTRTQPVLYYLPWELNQEQELTIKQQVAEAKAIIEEELREFKRRRDERLRELGVSPAPASPPAPDTVGPVAAEASSVVPAEASSPADAANRPPTRSGLERDHDDRGIMVETEEDTVIY